MAKSEAALDPIISLGVDSDGTVVIKTADGRTLHISTDEQIAGALGDVENTLERLGKRLGGEPK